MRVRFCLFLLMATSPVFANNVIDKCRFPAGVHFGESEVLMTEETRTQVFLTDKNAGKMGVLSDYFAFEAIKGDGTKATFYSENKDVSVTIETTSSWEKLGFWDSTVDLPEPDKHCATSADMMSYRVNVKATRVDGKATREAEAVLYCTMEGFYHGYWGKGDCPNPP